MEDPCIEMTDIQRTVFGLLLLVPQFCSVALPERWASVPISTPHLQEWSYPYPKDTRCTFPYIWQASVGRCCYPVFNCEPGSGIKFCSVDRGKDLCVECRNSSKQYHLVHSFDGVNATCFDVSERHEIECIVGIRGETLPARDIIVRSCGIQCECDPSKCFYGDDPCRCYPKEEKCKSNQQMNWLTGVCEACPWYGYKLKEDCDACSVNESLWMSGPTPTPNVTVPPIPNVTVPPIPNVTVPPIPNVTVLVTTIEGNLTNIITEETITKTTTALLPETKNDTTIRMVVIIGVVVTVVFFIAGLAVMYSFQNRTFCKRSGASSSQYTSISQVPFPSIAVTNQGPATEYQEENETSNLINNIPETNIQQSNGHIRQQSVSSKNHHHFVSHKVPDDMDSPKSSESGNDLGVHGHINERNQSASSNNESPENLREPREGTHQNDDLDQTSQFRRCPPVEKGHSWSFPRDSVADNDSLTVLQTLSGYEDVAQNTVPKAICSGDIDKRTDDNISKIQVKEFIRLLPLNSSAVRGPDLEAPNHEGVTCCEDSRILNKEPRIPGEEGHHVGPQYSTMPLFPTSPSNSSPFRPFLNRLISSSTDRPTAKVPPMRQETQNQRQDEVESNDSMSTDSSTDISMSYGLVHFARGAGVSFSDESLESSNPSLNSCSEDAPPSFSYCTNPPSTASHTKMENTEPRRIGGLRSATRNGSQIQMMANQSPGGPDGASVPSHHRENRVMEPRQVFETEVKEPQQSEETDPKTLLSSTQERDRNELQRQDSDSEDDPEKIGFKVNQAEDLEKLRDICEGLVYLGNPSDAAENSSDEVQGKTLENNEVSMSTDKSTDISMSYGVVHFPGAALPRDESLESTIPSLNSCCEDNPPSYSYITNSPNTASLTHVGKTEPKRPGDLRSATRNGSQIQMMANQSRGGPDGASQPSDYQEIRVREQRHEVFETEVPVQSEETDPKTSLSSTQLGDRNKVEIRKDSDSEDDPEKIVLKVILAEDTAKQIKNSYEDLAYPDIPLNAAENNSDEVQRKTSRKDFFAIGANASNEEIDFRNVSLHNDDKILYNKWAFSSELEHEENKLNSAAKSKLDPEETSDSYCSLQDKENIKKETKSFEDGGKDDGFRDSKSSLGEIEKKANDFISDTDPAVDEISSDQKSSPSEDEEVCLNGDAELNRELQQPSRGQIDVHNEFNSSSHSVNSDESGIDIEEQTIQHVQDS